MAAKTVFISFDYDNDLNHKNLLLAWDRNKQFDFRFYDASLKLPINSTNAPYIKTQIKPHIQAATHLLCIIGQYSSQSEWINWEIETANEFRRGLIGVKLDSRYTSPAPLLSHNARWAMSFTFDSIKEAVDSG